MSPESFKMSSYEGNLGTVLDYCIIFIKVRDFSSYRKDVYHHDGEFFNYLDGIRHNLKFMFFEFMILHFVVFNFFVLCCYFAHVFFDLQQH